jgi:hypothetical protein
LIGVIEYVKNNELKAYMETPREINVYTMNVTSLENLLYIDQPLPRGVIKDFKLELTGSYVKLQTPSNYFF